MFVSHRVVLDISFQQARSRLQNLTHGGWLGNASASAYSDGLAGLIRIGPFGGVLGASKLVKVSLLEPVQRADAVAIPLRWEATGATGKLFPVLDADLSLAPAGTRQTLMMIDGAYRPPLGAAGAVIDRIVLGHAADATVRSLLDRISAALADLSSEAGKARPSPAVPAAWAAGAPESLA
jgi:hypothetical protein